MSAGRISFCAVVAIGALATSDSARAEWLTTRGDAQRTGASPAVGAITTPDVVWRYYLGGHADQRTFDGTVASGGGDVVYLVASGRVEARRPDDTVVWQGPLDGSDTLVGVADLDGDGVTEVVAASRFSGRASVYDAATGALRWSTPDGRYDQIGVVYLHDVDGDALPELYVADRGTFRLAGSRWADLWNFAGALAAPARPMSIDLSTRDYDRAETEAWADVDGDGRDELVAFGRDTVYVYSSIDGALRASGNVGAVPYAQAQTIVADLDPSDAGDELALFTDVVYSGVDARRRVIAIDVVGTDVVTRWEHAVGDALADRHAFAGESVIDVDGDGLLDVVSSFYDATSGAWTTYARRGADGVVFASWDGRFVGAADVDGDGRAEVLTRPSDTNDYALAWDVSSSGAVTRWALSGARWVLETDPATATRQSLSARTMQLDVDGDGQREVIVEVQTSTGWKLRAFDLSVESPSAKATYLLPDGVTFLAVKRRALAAGERLLAARSDGYLAVLDHALTPTNEFTYPTGVVPGMKIGGYGMGWRGIGSAPLAANLLGDGAADLVVRDSRAALIALDASGATMSTPPSRQWSVLDQRWYPALVDTNGDGTLEVATGGTDSVVLRTASTGAAQWTAAVTGDTAHLTGHDVDGDGLDEIAYLAHDVASNDQVFGILSPTGAPAIPAELRHASSGRGSFAFSDLDGDGADEAIVQFGSYLRTVDGASGSILREGYTGILSMAPLIADIDQDGDAEIVSSGFLDYFRAFDLDSAGGWTGRDPVFNPDAEWGAYQYGALVSCGGAPRYAFAGQSSAHLRVIDPADATVVLDAYLGAGAAYATAADVPATDAPAYLGNVNAIASLGGDGLPRLLVGSTDGYLYALNACATSAAGLIAWSVDLGAAVGEAVPADVDGDGSAELVVSVADGYLYAIDHAAMHSVAVVGEVTRAGELAGGEVDELALSRGVAVEWTPVPGAADYEVAVVDGVGAVVRDFVSVGAVTSVRLKGLALEPDRPYYSVVRAVDARGVRSFEAISDGFRVAKSEDADPDAAGDGSSSGCSAGGGAGALAPIAGVLFALRRRRSRR